MTGIPPDIEEKLEKTLMVCGPFGSYEELRTIFVDSRIYKWRDLLLQASTPTQRIRFTIDLLHERYNDNQENALVLFLKVLSDRVPVADVCQRQLLELTGMLQNAHTIDSSDVGNFLRLAERDLSAGNFDSALELLYKAYQSTPNDMQIKQRYHQAKLRQGIQATLKKVEVSCQMYISTSSPLDAARVMHNGLQEVLAIPDTGLPIEVKNAVLSIFDLMSWDKFSDDMVKGWENVQSVIRLFGEYRIKYCHWLVSPVLRLVEGWAQIRFDICLRGAISSIAQLGDYLGGYRLAVIYLKRHPNDSLAISQFTEHKERLLSRVTLSAEKRLKRAEEAIRQGYFELAIENLNSLNEVYAPIEREFPGVLQEYDEVHEQKRMASQLKAEALNLQETYLRIKPDLELK